MVLLAAGPLWCVGGIGSHSSSVAAAAATYGGNPDDAAQTFFFDKDFFLLVHQPKCLHCCMPWSYSREILLQALSHCCCLDTVSTSQWALWAANDIIVLIQEAYLTTIRWIGLPWNDLGQCGWLWQELGLGLGIAIATWKANCRICSFRQLELVLKLAWTEFQNYSLPSKQNDHVGWEWYLGSGIMIPLRYEGHWSPTIRSGWFKTKVKIVFMLAGWQNGVVHKIRAALTLHADDRCKQANWTHWMCRAPPCICWDRSLSLRPFHCIWSKPCQKLWKLKEAS